LLAFYPKGAKIQKNDGSLPLHDACEAQASKISLKPGSKEQWKFTTPFSLQKIKIYPLRDQDHLDKLLKAYPECSMQLALDFPMVV
jgi:hypothetical protein